MYRGMKSIKPYNSKILFPAHLSKCTCWCQSRVEVQEAIEVIIGRGRIASRDQGPGIPDKRIVSRGQAQPLRARTSLTPFQDSMDPLLRG